MEFSEWYQAVRPRCYRAIRSVILDSVEAEDALSESFTRAFANYSSIKIHPAPEAWVVTTALNVHRDGFKKLNNPKRWLFAVRESGEDQATGLSNEMQQALMQLSVRQREVVALRILLDLSTEQTAEYLGISIPTVSTHLRRSLETLRQSLSAELGESHESSR